jgi:hypothetical protein
MSNLFRKIHLNFADRLRIWIPDYFFVPFPEML